MKSSMNFSFPAPKIVYLPETSTKKLQLYQSIMHSTKLWQSRVFSDNDVISIYHLFHELKLNPPYVIIDNMIASTMREYKKLTIPYGMMFAKILLYFKVPLEDEEFIFKVSKLAPKNIAHIKKANLFSQFTLSASKRYNLT